MSNIQNMHVKTDDFMGYVDLDPQGLGRVYYYRLADHKLWDNQSEFLEITAEGGIYEITHKDGSKAALLFKKDQVEVVSFAETAACKQNLFKENAELLSLAINMSQKELTVAMAKTIAEKHISLDI